MIGASVPRLEKGDKPMPLIRHIVLINWKKDVSPDQIDDWIRLCNRIPEKCPTVYNWCSSRAIAASDPNRPSSHEFCIMFDLRSKEEWDKYLAESYPELVYTEGAKIIDLERTASTNMLVETEPLRVKSQILSTRTTA